MISQFLSDVSISYAVIPSFLVGATARGVLWQSAPGRFLLDLPGVARYLVEGGNSVTIDKADGSASTQVEHFFKMTPLAALLYQRGIMAMHASAVCGDNGAVLIAGASGVGKSTLLAALLLRGWKMLADELSVVAIDESGTPLVFPDCPELALWPDAAEKLGISASSYYDSKRLKFSFKDNFVSEPKPLSVIFWLGNNVKEEVESTELHGAEKFQAVAMISYNSHIADALFDRVTFMQLSATISSSIPIRTLTYPRREWPLADIVQSIEKEL